MIDLLNFIKSLPLYYILYSGEKTIVLTHSGLEADFICRNEDGSVSVTASIDAAYNANPHKCLCSIDTHFMPTKILRQLDSFMIVGHFNTQQLNANESYEVYRGINYMCIDAGCNCAANGKLAILRLEDGAIYYV